MSLTARLIMRSERDAADDKEIVAPVRLIAKDRGTKSSFAMRRLSPAVVPSLPVAQNASAADAQPLRRTEETEDSAQPLRRTEDDAQPLRRSKDAEEANPLRRQEDDEAQPLRRSEEEEAQPLRRAEEEEAQPLRRTGVRHDAGLLNDVPAGELRHDTAGVALDGTARPMREIASPPTQTATADPAMSKGDVTMSDTPAAPAPSATDISVGQTFMEAPTSEPISVPVPPFDQSTTPQAQPASERPKVVIDQIDVVVAAPATPAPTSASQTGARALLARRYMKGF